MKLLLTTICALLLVHVCVAPPPPREYQEKKQQRDDPVDRDLIGVEYERYLREVIEVLENDPEFKRKLETAEEADIRSGKIAHELEYVDHNVRTKLDEIKRAELERLLKLAKEEHELSNGMDIDHRKLMPPQHLDAGNPHTFEIHDLKKLIHKVTSDLNEADKKRREEFKQYEMQKEFEHQEKLKHLEGAEKEAFEKELKDNETKHKQHDPLHHPGSKAQLEEVWEKQDHMKDSEFQPKVFFQLHDVDGNGYWDQNEVKALFVKELDKMYQSGAPEDDMRERAEELERMREHVYGEIDKNGDQLISYKEFLDQTMSPGFEKDEEWETLDQKPVYTHEEYMEFERQRQQEIQQMIHQGLIPPQPVYNVPPGYHHPQMQQQFHQASQHAQPQMQGAPAQYQPHPAGQLPPVHPGQFQQTHPGQPQQQQGQPHPAQFQQQGQAHPAQFQQQGQAHPAQFQQQGQAHPAQFQQQGQAHPSQFQQQQGHPSQFQQPPMYQQGQGANPPQHLGDPGVGQQQFNAPHPPQYDPNAIHANIPSNPNAIPHGQPQGLKTGQPNAPPQGGNVVSSQSHPNAVPQALPNSLPQTAHQQPQQAIPSPSQYKSGEQLSQNSQQPQGGAPISHSSNAQPQAPPQPSNVHPNSIGAGQQKV